MTRTKLLERIQALSEADLARVTPYLEADLDAVAELEDMREEIARARRDESNGLLDDEEVLAAVRRRLGSGA